MEAVNIIALSMGAAWASGINLYATIFMLGYMGITGNIVLPDELQILTDPMVMAAAGFMYCVEFFADKIPGVDSGWDTMHTFIRIPAGAMLAAGAVGDVSAAAELSAALLGGSLAAGSHATKAGGRLLINTSPEPVTNWGASISEDLLVIAGLWTALHHPVLFLIMLVVFVALMIWLLPRLWRLLKAIFSKVGRWLGLTKTPESSMGESTTNTEDTPVKKIEHDPN
ncbi:MULTISPECIES: DUF4126 domain-containing protein [unclassified Methylophaga]|jgi:hypothetical protein|uniref:DUF4126 domain-containing protein n=2 Tax=Methylophaga TaxID=40222 RepID=UPI00259CFEA5|nr:MULTISPECIES: DUF4126 domain-containing protein [unclassified Methylophaga]|tara:strand:+ start:1233 stop:1910 length:678 start_codon:yes stop_codon:yes gene_type:complete